MLNEKTQSKPSREILGKFFDLCKDVGLLAFNEPSVRDKLRREVYAVLKELFYVTLYLLK